MADNFLFEVDASKIIAKLHLAGRQPLKIDIGKGEMLANTGIKDDDVKATPDKPGNVSFDLKNSSKQYQVGYVVPVAYYKHYDLENALNALKDAYQKAGGDDSKINSAIDSKEQKAFDEAAEKMLASLDGVDGSKKIDKQSIMTKNGIDELEKFVKDQQKVDADDYAAATNNAKKRAAEQINSYMKVFAGEDNVKQINEQSLGYVFVAESVKNTNDKSFISDFQFQEAPDAEKQKMALDFKKALGKDPSKPNCNHRMCFYVNYTLDAEK